MSLRVMEKLGKFCPKRYFLSTKISGRQFSVTCLSKKSHYDVLGVTPQATMADIKKAYYNLSMLYHPDKSDGSADALEKFRKITEAYEILSNVNSKKLYDRGVLRSSPVEKTVPKTNPAKKTYVPQEAGRTPIYNFELWSRAHYGESIKRLNNAKKRYAVEQELLMKEDESTRLVVVVFSVSLFLIMCSVISGINSNDLDEPKDESESVVN